MSVFVVGAAGIDSKGIAHTPLVHGASNPGMIQSSFGGVARNIAENLARLSIPTTFITAIGTDASGESIASHCTQLGIDLSYSQRCPQHRTGRYISLANPDGDLAYAVSDYDIMHQLDDKYLMQQAAFLQNADYIIFDLNLDVPSIEVLLEIATAHHIPTLCNSTSPLRAGKLKPLLPQLHTLIANRGEANILSGVTVTDVRSAQQAARAIVQQGCDIAIVTLGEHGIVYATADQTNHVPTTPCPVLDANGASDALTAGLLLGLRDGASLPNALQLGMMAAQRTIASPLTCDPTLTRSDLYAMATLL